MGNVTIGRITILVRDLDAAQTFYERGFGFATLFDGEVAPGLRTVHVGPDGPLGAGIWFIQAQGDEVARVGHQTGGEPIMVLYVEDLAGVLNTLAAMGHTPHRGPDDDGAGYRVAHVRDNSGNELVIVQPPNA